MHSEKVRPLDIISVLFVSVIILVFGLSIYALGNIESNAEPTSVPPTNEVAGEWTGKDKDGTTITIIYDASLHPYTTKPDIIRERFDYAFEMIMADKRCSDEDVYMHIFIGMKAVVDNAQLAYGYSSLQIICS